MVESLVGVAVPIAVGFAAGRLGLRPVLVAAAVLSAAGVAALTTRLTETMAARGWSGSSSTPDGSGADRPFPLDSLRFLFGPNGRGAALMAVVWLVTGFVMALTPPIFGLYVTDRFGVGYAGLGAISTTMAIGATLGQLVGGQVADRIGHSRLMVFSLCLTVPSWIIVTLAKAPWLFGLLIVVTYLAAYLAASCWEAVGANAAPRRVRGGVTGIYGALQAAGAMLGAAVSGAAYSKNILLPWYIMAGADFTMLVLILAGRRASLRGFAPKLAVPEAGQGAVV